MKIKTTENSEFTKKKKEKKREKEEQYSILSLSGTLAKWDSQVAWKNCRTL